MPTVAEVEKLAFDLNESERAQLASRLLQSLPPVLHDEDEGMAEALRRDAEMDADPSIGITREELNKKIRERRR
jgi:putative addiction module component (TIGR02574 family)